MKYRCPTCGGKGYKMHVRPVIYQEICAECDGVGAIEIYDPNDIDARAVLSGVVILIFLVLVVASVLAILERAPAHHANAFPHHKNHVAYIV